MGLFDKVKQAAKEVAKQALKNVVTVSESTPSQPASAEPAAAEPVIAAKPQIEYSQVVDLELEQVADGEYEVVKFVGFEEENMEIPAEINGQRIVGIAEEAFFQLVTLTNLKIAEGIRYIGDKAFYQCPDLESVVLPETLEKLGEYCFAETNLTEIEIPESVVEIGTNCFSECKKLAKATLPDNMTKIPAFMFYGCESLEEFHFPSAISVIGDSALSQCGLILKELPQTLTVIEDRGLDGCFQDEEGLFDPVDEMRLPDTLTTIGEEGMAGINCLKLIVPASVKSIGKRAFGHLGSVEGEVEVVFEDGCTAELPEGLFFNGILDFSTIVSMTIPSSITVINEIFFGIDQDSFWYYVEDEYGRYVYDERGEKITKWERRDVVRNVIPENLTIYCDPGSAAMKFAREKGINCAKKEN